MMERFTLSSIKALVKTGAAIDITNSNPSLEDYRRLDPVGVSRGKYGMNGGLLKDNQTGQLYAITARNSVLFYYF